MGVLLLAGPYLFELEKGTDSLVLLVAGGALLLYSMLTKYELGFVKFIPLRVHLLLDLLGGLALAASPWLFGFSEEVFLPHLVLGLFEIIAVLLTNQGKGTTRLI